MKGSIGTATYLSYTRPYWGKVISKLGYLDRLSPQAKIRYKAINLYSLKVKQNSRVKARLFSIVVKQKN
jgi:hypothetical protein